MQSKKTMAQILIFVFALINFLSPLLVEMTTSMQFFIQFSNFLTYLKQNILSPLTNNSFSYLTKQLPFPALLKMIVQRCL